MICKLCLSDKPHDDFYAGKKVCKVCYNARSKSNYKGYSKEYYRKNKDRILKTQKKYKTENSIKELPATVNSRNNLWRINNRSKERLRHKRYYNQNKIKFLEKRLRRKQLLVGTFTKDEWSTLEKLCGGKCLRCGISAPMTVDHIIPISCGGNNTIQNIQPLCFSCNASKGTKVVDYRTEEMLEYVGCKLLHSN